MKKAILNSMMDRMEDEDKQVFFFHARFDLKEGSGKFTQHTMEADKRLVKKNSAITLAIVFDADGNYQVGEACCSRKDHFEKVKGRQIALGRALKMLESDPVHFALPEGDTTADRKVMYGFARSYFMSFVAGQHLTGPVYSMPD